MALDRSDFNFINTSEGLKEIPELCGWGGPELQREAFDMIGYQFERLDIKGSTPTANARLMMFEVARKILGEDILNYPQLIGDCVSFSAKNCSEHVQLLPIANGDMKVFKRTFPPYFYGAGRVFIGKKRLGWSDGSLGIWQAKAVMEYGVIPSDLPQCPAYSAKIAKDWGYNGPPQDFVTEGKKHIIKSAAMVQTWDDVVQSIINGYPVSVCSNVGYTMKAGSDGFHRRSGSWAHAMTIIGVDNDDSNPHACILNSWGDAHGAIKDFKTGENWPKGTLRVRPDDIQVMLKAEDSFAYSAFDGFPAQTLPRNFFNFV